MRKILTVAVSVLAGLVLGVVVIGSPLRVRAVSTATQNGDVNGDGQLDISDAVYLLIHMFNGGPEPVACADTPDLVARVAALEEAFQNSRALCRERPGRFTDNGDGTVTDQCTGLMWMKRSADVNPDGTIDPADLLTWPEAQVFVQSLALANRSDWRLPSIRELQDIVDQARANPAIDPAFEIHVGEIPLGIGGGLNSQYWAATPAPASGADSFRYTIIFDDLGYAVPQREIELGLVLAVRGP